MAHIHIPECDRHIDDPQEIAAFLKPLGITYECWDVEGRLGEQATDEEILEAYGPEIERLKAEGGYVTADVINVTPQTPGLAQMLNRFNKEHRHTEDEVRFIVRGRGIFHINPGTGPVLALQVEQGDLINVPAGTRHWFDLCDEKTIRAIRLFQDSAGWTPHYLEQGAHGDFVPMCWGTAGMPPAFPPGVKP